MSSLSYTRTKEPEWVNLVHEAISAEDLLKRYDFWEVPVPIVKLVRHLDIELYSAHLVDCSGKLEVDLTAYPPRARITVERMEGRLRQRFTIAHELGHLVLHAKKHANFNRSLRFEERIDYGRDSWVHEDRDFDGNRMEWQANGYAAALLMPLGLLGKWAEATSYNVDRLADLFMVSPQAMRIRMRRLFGEEDPWGR